MTRPDSLETVTQGFAIYPKGGGWRVWCLRTDAEAEPHQPVNYATPHIARIVAQSLQFACNM